VVFFDHPLPLPLSHKCERGVNRVINAGRVVQPTCIWTFSPQFKLTSFSWWWLSFKLISYMVIQMKVVVRLFFRSIRILLIPFMHLFEFITTPKGVVRSAAAQEEVDRQSRNLVLYQFKTCPFCIKVRREIKRLSLPIELRDAQKNQQNRAALLQGGGQVKVPCLQIKDEQGKVQWMYESTAINQYLHQRFGVI